MSGASPDSDSPPAIVCRLDWGARDSTSNTYLTHKQPLPFVFIHHSATPLGHSQTECSKKVRGFQNYHMDEHGWADIGYSFVIGGDGTVFEGRGWDRVGAHTKGYNAKGLGICLIGNFMDVTAPTEAQIESTQQLIAYGVSLGKLSPDYKVLGHRDVGKTLCPGTNLYTLIQSWPHYGQQNSVNE